MSITAKISNPINNSDDDLYGYTALAVGLSSSILRLTNEDCTVIGIEGPWGSGKTSLLNLLMNNLNEDKPTTTQVIKISPWLSSSRAATIEDLLIPVAARLDEIKESSETENGHPLRRFFRKRARKASRLAMDVLRYAQQASGRITPFVELAGNLGVPGAGIAASAMKNVSAADLSTHKKTMAELRDDIDKEIEILNLRFIVLLDDLDRLEPAQAVDVLRLVRSVADFKGFLYILCYDHDVLSAAVENTLGLNDGHKYLQKIIPLSFNLPRQEAFDLRREFRKGAMHVFEENHGVKLDSLPLNTFNSMVDIYGVFLSTSREVAIILNSLRFIYPTIRDYVYFTDLCFLQLIKVVNTELYHWIEHYLTEWSVLETGDGKLSDKEKTQHKEKLLDLLNKFNPSEASSSIHFSDWVPGIVGHVSNENITLFNKTDVNQQHIAEKNKRLSSYTMWRFYFSFSAPQNVLSESDIQQIISLAESDYIALSNRLKTYVVNNNISSMTWFEHVIIRLTSPITEIAPNKALYGLLKFFFEETDVLSKVFQSKGVYFGQTKEKIDLLASKIIGLLKTKNRVDTLNYLHELTENGQALFWITEYLRKQLWDHGLAGNRPIEDSERLFTADEIKKIKSIAAKSLSQ